MAMNSPQPAPLFDLWAEHLRALPELRGPDWLDRLRDSAAREFMASGFPNRKTEDWKYTSLRKLEQLAPGLAPVETPEVSFPEPVCGPDTKVIEIAAGQLTGSLPDSTEGLT